MGTIYTPAILNGQILMSGGSVWGWPTGVSGYSATYQTIYDSFSTKPTSSTAAAQDTMVNQLVLGGFWNRMDLFYVFATDATATEAKTNWKNPGTYNLADPGSTNPTWTSLQGFKGDGSTDYLDTEWDPTNNGVNYVLNSATMGFYITEPNDGGADYIFGRGTSARLCPCYSDEYYISTIHGANLNGFGQTTTTGCFIGTRTSSTNVAFYVNGTNFANSTTNNSISITGDDFRLLSNVTTYSAAEIAIAWLMDGVSNTDASAINTIIQAYITAITP